VRVYAESNFVLEIVLEQEQHRACEELVKLAATKSIELVLPAFALLEPYQTIVRRKTEGKGVHDGLVKSARQLQRTAWIAADVPRLREAADILLRAEQEASKRFLDVRTKLLDVARMVVIDGSVLRAASELTTQLDLELPDALFLASVLGDADEQPLPSIFINRNTKDFDDPDVKARLRRVACDLVGKFDDGLARVKSVLAKNAAT
jgi:predicted nucleic acid-binding protein